MMVIDVVVRNVGFFFNKNFSEIDIMRNKVTELARICTESDNALTGNSLSLTHSYRRVHDLQAPHAMLSLVFSCVRFVKSQNLNLWDLGWTPWSNSFASCSRSSRCVGVSFSGTAMPMRTSRSPLP